MDFAYLAAIGAYLVLTLGLVAGCAALERKRECLNAEYGVGSRTIAPHGSTE
jgi:hypothetical protein